MTQEMLFIIILGAICLMVVLMQILTIIYAPKPSKKTGLVRLERDNDDSLFANLTVCEILNGISLTEKGIIIKEVRYWDNTEVLWVTKSFYKNHWFLLKQAGFKKKEKENVRGGTTEDVDTPDS